MPINITDNDAIKLHLSGLHSDNQFVYFSSFIAALRDARKFTGREMDTGIKMSGYGDHGSWLGAIGYMTLMDQIGKCFRPVSQTKITDANSITKCLRYFTTLSNEEIDAIYALRCAFAHDYSLLNISTTKPQLNHRFTVYQGNEGNVVTLPSSAWDGDRNSDDMNTITLVNLEGLGDLVESICRHLLYLSDRNELVIDLKGGVEELTSRYGIVTPKR